MTATKTKKQEKPSSPVLTPQAIADKLREKFITAASEVADRHDPIQVVNALVQDLQKQKAEVAARLLGLNTQWSQPELKDASVAATLVKEEVRKILEVWVNQIIAEFLTEENKTKLKNQFRKALLDRVEHEISSYSYIVSKKAEAIAKEMIDQSADEVRKELNLPIK